jgi:arsenate reductase (glutaredoxin)
MAATRRTTLYWKSTCSTCREAQAVVKELDPDHEDRNFAKKPLTASEIEALLDLTGGVEAVLSTRSVPAKALGWNRTTPDRATYVAAAAADNNLVRRPILVSGKDAVIGKDLPAIRALLRP